jgi:hypothetical protein
VVRLVEEHLDVAGKEHRRHDPKALIARLAAELNPFLAHLGLSGASIRSRVPIAAYTPDDEAVQLQAKGVSSFVCLRLASRIRKLAFPSRFHRTSARNRMVKPRIASLCVVSRGDSFQAQNPLPDQTTENAICGDFTGAMGLEPATSGVTGVTKAFQRASLSRGNRWIKRFRPIRLTRVFLSGCTRSFHFPGRPPAGRTRGQLT